MGPTTCSRVAAATHSLELTFHPANALPLLRRLGLGTVDAGLKGRGHPGRILFREQLLALCQAKVGDKHGRGVRRALWKHLEEEEEEEEDGKQGHANRSNRSGMGREGAEKAYVLARACAHTCTAAATAGGISACV